MAEKIKIDVLALRDFVTQYKATFTEHRLGADNEIYKWKAVKCFQDNWDIEAEDFLAMVKASLAQTYNLLASQNNFPGRMIEAFIKAAPNEVRSMFRELFNESIDLAQRVGSFEKRAVELCKLNPTLWKSHYQTPNSISTYLWLRYPEKYYIYKYSVIKDNAQKLCGIELPSGKYDRMIFGFSLYDAMCEELAKDSELTKMSKGSLTGDCYPDDALRTLTIDVGYFIGKHTSAQTAKQATETSDERWQREEYQSRAARMAAKNIILYGPPGTGKTYSTVQYAVSIIEEKPLEHIKNEDYAAVFSRYKKYKQDGLIAFTTFHQSFGYEEFIEGIRPVVASGDNLDDGKELEYEIRDGIFKEFCDKAGTPISGNNSADLGIGKSPSIWKVSLEGAGENPTRTECFEKSHIRIGYDGYGETLPDSYAQGDNGKNILNAFYYKMQIGDIVLSCYSNKTVDDIGVITGEPEWRDEYPQYKRLRKVKWLVAQINEDIYNLNSQKLMMQPSVYKMSIAVSDLLSLLRKVKPSLFTQNIQIPNRIFIIDEINRGNISKIFGELITLIEPSKRIGAAEGQKARLPYSGQDFGVPDNVFIVGTMNTADRSIRAIDTALRRRFIFVEMKPDSSLLRDVIVEGIELAEMLDTMNCRITALLDREHVIGHSAFLPSLKDEPTVEKLAEIFENTVIPLLQEYFYDDYEKIQLVLGDNQKDDDRFRFVVKKSDTVKLFGNAELDYPEYYEVNREAFKRIEAYAFLN